MTRPRCCGSRLPTAQRGGAGRRREIVLWQRVIRLDWMPGLLTIEVPEHLKALGTWMHDGPQLRDQWESKLPRSTRWSPVA